MFRLFVLACSMVLLISCQLSGQNNYSLSPQAFEEKSKEAGIQLLDVRTPEEFNASYLQGALQANWMKPAEFTDRTSHLNTAQPVLVYCASGGRSAEAAKQLRTKGFTVYELEGGLNRYKKEGRPVVIPASIKQTTSTEYNKLIRQSSVVLVDFGAAWCPPCRKMEPVLAELLQKYPGKFVLQKMDGGNETELMGSLQIDALPHFLVYKNGVKTWSKQGVVDLQELEQAIQ